MVTVGEYKPAAVSWRDCMAGYVIRTPGLPVFNDRDGESSVTPGVSTVTAPGVTRRRPRPGV